MQETGKIDCGRVSGLDLRLYTRREPVWSVRQSGPYRVEGLEAPDPLRGEAIRRFQNANPGLRFRSPISRASPSNFWHDIIVLDNTSILVKEENSYGWLSMNNGDTANQLMIEFFKNHNKSRMLEIEGGFENYR